ncbi:MAG TPA: outer membrane beta-barrel protein [Bacteroidia bacterium]|nr:outer membrane beta-barrel protein [Bacteroidia bacterium]
MTHKLTRCLLFVIATGLFVNSVLAQEIAGPKPPRVYLGASVSFGYAKVFYPDASGAYGHTSYQPSVPVRTGIELKIRLTDQIHLSTGFQYDLVGQKIEETYTQYQVSVPGQMQSFKYKATLGYMELPLRIDLRFSKSKFSTFLTAGGYAGVFFRGKSSYEYKATGGAPFNYSNELHYNSSATLRSQMYSNLQLGYGLDLTINQLKMQFYPLYEAGLAKFNNGYIYRHRLGAALSVLYGF